MSNIEISASVSAGGKLKYKQVHSIPDATQEQMDWMNAALVAAYEHAVRTAAEPKEDNDNYSSMLQATVGDTVYPDTPLDNLSFNAVVKQANYWQQHVTGEILKIGEKVAKDKKKDARKT